MQVRGWWTMVDEATHGNEDPDAPKVGWLVLVPEYAQSKVIFERTDGALTDFMNARYSEWCAELELLFDPAREDGGGKARLTDFIMRRGGWVGA